MNLVYLGHLTLRQSWTEVIGQPYTLLYSVVRRLQVEPIAV